jgi:hypothetical protein
LALLTNPRPSAVFRIVLVATGLVATVLAIAGAILPGLPTTPFLLVALWAFARSSDRLYGWLERVPLLKSALAEAHRFEERRAVRLPVKIFAMTMGWGSVLVSGLTFGPDRPVIFAIIIAAVIAATIFMWIIPTDRD